MRIPTALPLDERPDKRATPGLWTETHRATIRRHHFLPWTPWQTTRGILNFLVCVPDRAGRGKLPSVESH